MTGNSRLRPYLLIMPVVMMIAAVGLSACGEIPDNDKPEPVFSELPSREAPSESHEESESTADPESGEETEEEGDHRYLICVPAEYISLREQPDQGGAEIAQLTAGTVVEWIGDHLNEDETDYFRVKVKDSGMEGYVSADYCVEAGFPYDESALDIVHADRAMYTYEDMVEDINALVSKYPDRLSKEIIGTSVDGRDIFALVLGDPDAEKHVMLQAGIHGREYMNSQLVMKMTEYYCAFYDDGLYNGKTYRELFGKTAFHVIPMSNPDGVTISQFGTEKLNNPYLGDFLYSCYEIDRQNLCYEINTNGDYNWSDHYKEDGFVLAESGNPREITFDEYLTIWKANANGVDINNNFDAGWADIDLKSWPSYGSYKGDGPVSEPETAALRDYAQRHDYECFVSYHSMGQLIYYDVKGNKDSNSERSRGLSELFKSHIKYDTVNTNGAYNVNLGGFGDWVQLSLDKPSVTIESGKKPCPLEIGEFVSIWNRHRESWAMLADRWD